MFAWQEGVKNTDKSNWQAQVLASGSATCLSGDIVPAGAGRRASRWGPVSPWELGAGSHGLRAGSSAQSSPIKCKLFPLCCLWYDALACAVP